MKHINNNNKVVKKKDIDIDKSDDFPYKRIYTTDDQIHEMFNKLQKFNYKDRILIKSYVLKNINFPSNKLLFMNEPVLLINKESDYNNWNTISDMFQEKCRMKCKLYGQNLSAFEYWFNNKDKIKQYSLKNYGKDTPFYLRESIYHLTGECTSHRPNIIMSMIQMFNSKTVLDFSAGWGDRLIGCMAANIDFYCGVDPNSCLYDNYIKMIKFFNKSTDKFFMIESTIEDAILPDKKFDLIFTSPPYFDLEIYTKNNKQSSRYTTEYLWFNNFLKEAINKVWKYLKNGGIMCININQKNRKEHYIEWMLEYVKTFKDSYYMGVISYANEKIANPQPIWIWKKK